VPVSAAAFRLILLTVQRPGEVFTMRWRDIEDGVWWVISAEVAKNGEPNRVYLSPQVREILGELHQHTGASPWALESPRKRGTHLTTIKTATQSILRRTEMRPWSPHAHSAEAGHRFRSKAATGRSVATPTAPV
jgi:integrase